MSRYVFNLLILLFVFNSVPTNSVSTILTNIPNSNSQSSINTNSYETLLSEETIKQIAYNLNISNPLTALQHKTPDFRRFLANIPEQCQLYFSTIFSMIDQFIKPGASLPMQVEPSTLAKIKNEFLRISNSLNDGTKKEPFKPFETDHKEYFNLKLYMKDVSASLFDLLNTPDKSTENLRNKKLRFMSQYQYHKSLEGSKPVVDSTPLNTLTYHAMMNTAVYEALLHPDKDVIGIIRKYSRQHRRLVQNFMKKLLQLTIKTVEIKLTYLKLHNQGRRQEQHIIQKWTELIKFMVNRMLAVDYEIKSNVVELAKKELNIFAYLNRFNNNDKTATAIYNHLTAKYWWHTWFVMVYDEVSGFENHALAWCHGHAQFRLHGKNYVIASVGLTSSFNKGEAASMLNSLEGVTVTNNHAKNWLDLLMSKTGGVSCLPYAFRGFVCQNCNAQVRAPQDRVVRRLVDTKKHSCWFSWFRTKCGVVSDGYLDAIMFG